MIRVTYWDRKNKQRFHYLPNERPRCGPNTGEGPEANGPEGLQVRPTET